MWNFIKYSLCCMGITISAAFGYNPSGLTPKTAFTGVITAIIILAAVMEFYICLLSYPRNGIDDTVKAYSLTFGNNIGGYYGYDYYWYACW